MTPDRIRLDHPAARPCAVSWCRVRHSDLAAARWVTHSADLATSTGGGERLTVRLVWCEACNGGPADNPHVLLTVTQEDTGCEPLPPGMLQLDRRRAGDLARVLTAACGPHWLADALDRAVRKLDEHRPGPTRAAR